jgi:phosphoribosylformylglycinamidine cyclo-ligase/phosphoribosylamine--glycine ligase/phosphoribosylformylglycinamidine cyclo-ligase
MQQPVLVASTDGVGTKVKLAAQAGSFESIGEDLVNHCINDILVQGARPLFFMDYFATSRLQPEMVASVVTGIAKACKKAGIALLGGETAEMPGVYAPDEFDLAGTIVGVVEKANILPRIGIQPGDVLIGLVSSGPHTNGYSLIRKVFENIPLKTYFPELNTTLGAALLAPHRAYLHLLGEILPKPQFQIKALAHLTGGGFLENIPRVLPENTGAEINLGSWPVPPLFDLIQQWGRVDDLEMYRVFNMGIGMVIITSADTAAEVRQAIPEETWLIGHVTRGEKKVTLV